MHLYLYFPTGQMQCIKIFYHGHQAERIKHFVMCSIVCFLITGVYTWLLPLRCECFSAWSNLPGHAQRVQGDEWEHLQRHSHQWGERHQAATNPQHAHSKERDAKAHLWLGQSLQWPPDGGWKLYPAALGCGVVGLSEKRACCPWTGGAEHDGNHSQQIRGENCYLSCIMQHEVSWIQKLQYHPQKTQGFSLSKAGIDQNVALHALSAARNFAF